MDEASAVVRALAGSLQELADELGVSYATVRAWGAGRRTPRTGNRKALARLARGRALELLRLARAMEGTDGDGDDSRGRHVHRTDDTAELTSRGDGLVRELHREMERTSRLITGR